MRMLFGTDGIRGVAGSPPLDHPTVFAIGAALGKYLAKNHREPAIVIGQDTRESSRWLSDSLTQGLQSQNVRVTSAGVITTPAVAFFARQSFSAGIVISASHNPWTDNGIKVFGHDGYKLSDEIEEVIETEIFTFLHGRNEGSAAIPSPRAGSSLEENPDLLNQYVEWIVKSVANTDLRHMRVLVDCANGAAIPVAHKVLSCCGIKADFIHDHADGRNINEQCGALHPEIVAKRLTSHPGKYDIGITFDGDADRALFSDEQGRVVNGDGVLLLQGRAMKAQGTLKNDTVVATTMSNMGLETAFKNSGIRMLRAPVGDKYVLEEMIKSGAVLGGEQSGHIIFRDGDATTGDGLLTALRVLQTVAESKTSLSSLVSDLKVYPQQIKNVRVREKKPLDQIATVISAISEAERDLDGTGRVVVRYSGTEALARVMVEAESEEKMLSATNAIADAIQAAIGV